jgi:hypothetical protein
VAETVTTAARQRLGGERRSLVLAVRFAEDGMANPVLGQIVTESQETLFVGNRAIDEMGVRAVGWEETLTRAFERGVDALDGLLGWG